MMKTTTLNYKLLFILFTLVTCKINAQYDQEEKLNKNASIVYKDDKCGLLYMGKLALPIKYDEIYVISEDKDPILHVTQDSLSGLIRSNGEVILPVENRYIDDNGNYFMIEKKGKFGIVTHKGKILFPVVYDKIEDLEGAGMLLQKEGKWGAANQKGKIIIPVNYKSIQVCSYDDMTFQVETAMGKKFLYIEDPFFPYVKPMNGYSAVSSSLFFKTTELSIADWFAFLNDVRNYDQDHPVASLLPDTTKIEQKLLPVYRILIQELLNEEDSGRKYYPYKFTNNKKTLASVDILINDLFHQQKLEKMMPFPVTGITYEQGKAYLNWLNKKSEMESFTNGYTTNYRFPTPEEWEKAALSGISDNMQSQKCLDSINVKGCMLFIYKDLPKCSNYEDYIKYSFGEGSTSTLKMNPDMNGNINVFGNVAEMTSEKGISKGGSFMHTAKDAKTDHVIPYTNAEPWLGIRIVAEMQCTDISY